MRNRNFKTATSVSAVLLFGFIILFPFFGTKAQKVKKENRKEQREGDTPRHKTIIIRDGDLDKALAGIEQVNLDSINITVQNALAGINFDSIGKTIEASMKMINSDSLRLQIERSFKSIDMQKMQTDMQKAMAESQKAMAESQKAMLEIQNSNWQKEFEKGMKEMRESMKEMKLQMPDIKKEMEAAQKEMANAKIDMKAEMAKAKLDMDKARAEITELKSTLAEMKKDGLIKEAETVKLEWKNGRLYINGKEQTQAVSDKYRKLEKIDFQNDEVDEEDD